MSTIEPFEPYEEDEPSIESLGGYKRGEQVRVIEDNEDEGYYVGEEGIVCGFWQSQAATDQDAREARQALGLPMGSRQAIMVTFPDRDPVEVRADDMEPI